jgi:hypothetical protein
VRAASPFVRACRRCDVEGLYQARSALSDYVALRSARYLPHRVSPIEERYDRAQYRCLVEERREPVQGTFHLIETMYYIIPGNSIILFWPTHTVRKTINTYSIHKED